MPVAKRLLHLLLNILALILDALTFLKLCFRSRASLAAKNLFPRKQLAVYLERQVKPWRAVDATRLSLVFLSRLFEWRPVLTIVKPGTLIGWHRKSFRLFWRWKSKPRGRPRLPLDLRNLIKEIAVKNPTRGEERIADELLIKLGIRVSPRTVRRHIPESPGPRNGVSSQRWRFLPLENRDSPHVVSGLTHCDYDVAQIFGVSAVAQWLHKLVACS